MNNETTNLKNVLTVHSDTITIQKKSPKLTQNEILFINQLGFIYGSVKLDYLNGKKKLSNMGKWKEQHTSNYNEKFNGVYIKTGKISNCFIIDIDDITKPEAKFIYEKCMSCCNLICKTNKGYHFYFIYDDDLNISNTCQEYGFDIRADGGIIICPPSWYFINNIIIKYQFIKKPENNKLQRIPEELKVYILPLIKHGSKNIKSSPTINSNEKNILYLALKKGIENLNPNRNNNYNDWIRIGMLLNNYGEYGINLWKDYSKQCDNYNEEEINKKVNTFSNKDDIGFGSLLYWLKQDNSKYYKQYLLEFQNIIKPINKSNFPQIEGYELDKLYDLKDRGYIKMYYNKFRYSLICTSQEIGTFYLFNKTAKLWEFKTIKDIQNHFMDNMKVIIEPLIDYYMKIASNYQKDNKLDQSKVYDKKIFDVKYTPEFYKASKSKYLMPLIVSEFYDSKFVTLLNNQKELLPVKDGVINLKTGEYRKRIKTDYFTFELDVVWKGLDFCTKDIDKFFDDIMLNNKEMIVYLQKILGYAISGFINEQKFIIFHGNGSNGKGVLQNLLKNLMKEYYRQLTSDVVMESKKNTAGGASPHLMQLLGARVAFVDESEMGGKLNESIVKNVTGGSLITARPLYGNPITFEPTFQLFLLTNHKPEINVNQSIERRIVLIPFLAEFKEPLKYVKDNPKHRIGDKDIELKLLQHLNQFIVWLIKGSIKYFKEGLGNVPKLIKEATNDYLNENDDLGNLIKEECITDANGFIYHCDLFDKYKSTYNKNISTKIFTAMMKDKGYSIKRKKDGTGFGGIKLKEKVINFID